MLNEHSRHFSLVPRHELRTLEETGIKTDFPFGRTIITASVGSSKDRYNENPEINFFARENAVWLTYKKIVGEQSYDFIIGPDGKPSPIAIRWDESIPKIFILDGAEMKKIEGIGTNEKAKFINTPENAKPALVYKNYVDPTDPDRKFTEFYGIIRLPANPGTVDFTYPATFKPYIAKETLVSGMKNRRLSVFPTSFWAVRVTGKSELPFGQELLGKK